MGAFTDFIYSPLFYDSATLFENSTKVKGRMFAIFRHPIERAISLFHYLQKANWEKTFDAELSSQSLEEYAQSSKAEHNWMTRILVNKMTEEVSLYDLELAKLILNKKCIVGL